MEGHGEADVGNLDVKCDDGLNEGDSKSVDGNDDVHMG